MPYVRAERRAAPVVPVRPALPPHQTVARLPVNSSPHVAPRIFPILQPPIFSQQSDFIYENKKEQQQQQDETHDHPEIVDNNHSRKTTQQISVRVPTFIPQQNYPKQPLSRLSTRPIRYAEPKYASHLYTIK
jgi:hypothetical protein